MKTAFRPWLVQAVVKAALVLTIGLAAWTSGAAGPVAKPTPVILDTDIGDGIDDTWALGLLLKCPEVDLKLVVSDYGRPRYRSRLLGKLLQAMGRADIPIGVGMEVAGVGGEESQGAWLGDYDLKSYPGRVHPDGIQAMIDLIMAAGAGDSDCDWAAFERGRSPEAGAAHCREGPFRGHARECPGGLRGQHEHRGGMECEVCAVGLSGGSECRVGGDDHPAGHVRSGPVEGTGVRPGSGIGGSGGAHDRRELPGVGGEAH